MTGHIDFDKDTEIMAQTIHDTIAKHVIKHKTLPPKDIFESLMKVLGASFIAAIQAFVSGDIDTKINVMRDVIKTYEAAIKEANEFVEERWGKHEKN